ncbi:hypothetical protein An09g02680 [Aspergillus niger]|uniref:Uncharacterized protein n=2 Tax=Aspergillus niger TaxID=5061 RepID=A2QTM9_ASPNC|nr:hypothetical protein An09g02680 [Aspergillus niger]CAK40204.1 hypothetical protein An09g02680 [Aspergillus niger]
MVWETLAKEGQKACSSLGARGCMRQTPRSLLVSRVSPDCGIMGNQLPVPTRPPDERDQMGKTVSRREPKERVSTLLIRNHIVNHAVDPGHLPFLLVIAIVVPIDFPEAWLDSDSPAEVTSEASQDLVNRSFIMFAFWRQAWGDLGKYNAGVCDGQDFGLILCISAYAYTHSSNAAYPFSHAQSPQVHNHEFVRPSFSAGSQNGPIIPDLAGQVTLGGLSTPIVSCPRPVIAACVAVTSTVFQVVSIVPVQVPPTGTYVVSREIAVKPRFPPSPLQWVILSGQAPSSPYHAFLIWVCQEETATTPVPERAPG